MSSRRTSRLAVALLALAMSCSTNDAATRIGVPMGTPLPAWASVLAGPLPATTARMLRLDRTQRVGNPLGAHLAARLRLEVAATLGCEPVAAAAAEDLRAAPAGRHATPTVALAVAFARRLTREGHAITDAEFAALLDAFGPEATTAVVHTIAYANFLCRIVAGLGVTGAMPVVAVGTDEDAPTNPAIVPPRRRPTEVPTADVLAPFALPWSDSDHARVCSLRDRQIERAPRIPMPGNERLEGLTGRAEQMAARVAWSRVGYGYQRELTRQWFACLYSFYEESRIDPVFENAMFWVVTRTNDCFY